MDETNTAKNYLKNTKTSRERTIRLEVVGEVTANERHFLDGCAWLMAGTLTRDDAGHLCYVSGLMSKLVKQIVKKLRGGEDTEA